MKKIRYYIKALLILGGIALLSGQEVFAQMEDEYLDYLYDMYGGDLINEYNDYNDYLDAGNEPVEFLETGSIPLFFDDPPTCEAEDLSNMDPVPVIKPDPIPDPDPVDLCPDGACPICCGSGCSACQGNQTEKEKEKEKKKEKEEEEKEEEEERDPCEDSFLSDHVYGENRSINYIVPISPIREWHQSNPSNLPSGLKFRDDDSGFNSQLYEKTLPSGQKEYCYVTQGTDMLEFSSEGDWRNDVQQASGIPSRQYEISTDNAQLLAEWAKENHVKLTFSGHSLGGGLASANALRTGLSATTYNAAALHPNSYEFYNLDYRNAKIDAYVVAGEIVDLLNQSTLGKRAEGTIHTIHIPNEATRNVLASGNRVLHLSEAGARHLMSSIRKALGCDD